MDTAAVEQQMVGNAESPTDKDVRLCTNAPPPLVPLSREVSGKSSDENVLVQHSCEEEECATESDHTDTDYELESSVRHASKKRKCRLIFEDLGSPSIFKLLSPSVREVTKNVELIRLPMVGLRVQGCHSDNTLKKELWPGVACSGAALQCIHCREPTGRRVIQSLSLMWQHLGLLAYYHFPQCKKIPSEIKLNLQTLVPRFSGPNFQTFQTELGLLCQHVSESLQRNTEIHVPLVQTHLSLIRSRGRSRGRGTSRSRDRLGGREGLKVTDIERLVHLKGPNGKIFVSGIKILDSNSTTFNASQNENPDHCAVVQNSKGR